MGLEELRHGAHQEFPEPRLSDRCPLDDRGIFGDRQIPERLGREPAEAVGGRFLLLDPCAYVPGAPVPSAPCGGRVP